jgi:uncharacterized protein
VTNIFLDTVGLIAIWNNSDQWHDVASQAYESLKLRDVKFFTTTFVLLECGNAVSRKPLRKSVLRLREQLILSEGLIAPSHEDCEHAWREYDQGHPGTAGIVDCVSFVVMRRLGIAEAFTNDQHFQDADFKTSF